MQAQITCGGSVRQLRPHSRLLHLHSHCSAVQFLSTTNGNCTLVLVPWGSRFAQLLHLGPKLRDNSPHKHYKAKVLPDIFNNAFLLRSSIHDTRNASSFHVPKCRTNIRLFSFQFQGPLFFNSLSPDIQNSISVATFKNKMKKHLLT